MAAYSRLADAPMEGFTHNNMVPFFGAKLSQNVDLDRGNDVVLRNHTGVTRDQPDKIETGNFGDMSPHIGVSQQHFYTRSLDRIENSRLRTNELPQEQLRVGPGTRDTDPVAGAGGFHQDNFRDLKMYPSVNELRAKTHPKNTYQGRVLSGKGPSRRGAAASVAKNRPDTFVEMSESDMIPTSGVSQNTARSCPTVRPTNRRFVRSHTGPAHLYVAEGAKRPDVRASERTQHGGFDVRSQRGANRKTHGDYGRAGMMVYDTQRNNETHTGVSSMLSTIVKAMAAPIMDAIRPTTREYLVQNAREYGPVQAIVAHKPTVHNPNDVARTTVKETTIHDARTGNMRSYEKTTVYDPNDVARTTIKETNIHDTRTGPVRPLPGGYATAEDEARVTVRETGDEPDRSMNMRGGAFKSTVYDPSDIAKTTVRETTTGEVPLGAVGAAQDGDGYRTTNMYANPTNKQITSDNFYAGQPERENADGYRTTNPQAPITSKQITSDNEHFGMAGHGEVEAATSYEAIYNAIINADREGTLVRSVPTASGTKVTQGSESVHLTSERGPSVQTDGARVDRIYQSSATTLGACSTREPISNARDQRLDPSLLTPFRDNPYTHSLSSVA